MITYSRIGLEVFMRTRFLKYHDVERNHDIVVYKKQSPISTTKCGLNGYLALNSWQASPVLRRNIISFALLSTVDWWIRNDVVVSCSRNPK